MDLDAVEASLDSVGRSLGEPLDVLLDLVLGDLARGFRVVRGGLDGGGGDIFEAAWQGSAAGGPDLGEDEAALRVDDVGDLFTNSA